MSEEGEVHTKTIRDLNRKERDLYKRAEQAYDGKNYKYAVDMYRRVLKSSPDCMEVRAKLHDAQLKSVGNKGSFLGGMTAMLKSAIGGMSADSLVNKEEYGKALDVAEEAMTADPTSAAACQFLADVAYKCDMPLISKMALEQGRKYNEKNIHLLDLLASCYVSLNEGNNALKVYQKLAELQPNNKIWPDKVKEAAALASMERSNMIKAEQGNANYRDMMKDQEEAALLEQKGRSQATAVGRQQLIDSTLADIERGDSVEKRTKVAELLRDDKQWDLALEHYLKANEIAGVEDPSILRAMTDVKTYQLQDQVRQVRAQVEAGELDQAAADEQISALEWKSHDIRLEDAQYLLKKFPNNHDVRFEIAELLVEEDRFKEALPHFQKVQQNPRYKIRATLFVGRCFMGDGVFDLAVDQFQSVVDAIHHMDENKKDAYYSMGQCYLKQGKEKEALNCFKEIYQQDVSYRDVQELVIGQNG